MSPRSSRREHSAFVVFANQMRTEQMPTNRRQVIQSAAAGAGLAVASSVTISLRADARQTPPTSQSIDTLRIAMSSLPPQLDPQTDTFIVMVRVYNMAFDTLIQRDWANGGALVPGLATSWTQVDETTLELVLRPGVTFQDGSPFTANDVKFTFDRTIDGDARLAANGRYGLTAVQAVDDLTVRLITDGPRGNLLLLLTDPGAEIVPAAYFQQVGYEAFQQMPLGTGPYRVTEFVPDTRIAFTAHTGYWGGAPAAASVEVVPIPEVSTRLAALQNGEIDMAMDLPPDQISDLEKDGQFAISTVSPLNLNIFAIVGANPPMDRKEVRQALNLGIDRQAIVEQLLGGYGVWPTGLQSTLDPLYTERPQIPYDPDRARELLATAGYAGEEIRLAYDSPNYYPLEQEWTQVIVSGWSEIGLNVTMSPIELNQREAITAESDYHLYTTSSGNVADVNLAQVYAKATAEYQILHTPGQFDELNNIVAQAQQTVDEAQRRDLYAQALTFLDDFVMVLPLFTINRNTATKPTIAFQETPRFGIELRPGRFTVSG
jgi:peptide/nickel transport system substrate-binding protein